MSKFGGVLIAIAALALAALLLARSGARTAVPDDQQYATQWMCETCGRMESLTPREFQKLLRGERVRRDHHVDPRQTVFYCDSCGTFSVCRAQRCEEHGQWFVWRHADGDDGGCPKCPP